MTPFKNLIGGEWTASHTGATFETRNPADTDEVVGVFQKSDAEDARQAIEAAKAAQPAWAAIPAPKRGEILHRAAAILESRADQVAREMTREEGKTLPEARGEVGRAINILRYVGGEGARLGGEYAPSERDRVFIQTRRRPLGVVGLITPWNFPIAIPTWKAAPALICGNAVVLKPSDLAPLCAVRLVEALHEAGVTKGAINLVTGPGSKVGNELVTNPAVRAISFTGSEATGSAIAVEAAKRRARVQLEMGGKNPTIVLADADIADAVNVVVNAAFFSTGQRCTATSRVIVEEPVVERFTAALVERAKTLKVGNGLEAGIEIGPSIDCQTAGDGPRLRRRGHGRRGAVAHRRRAPVIWCARARALFVAGRDGRRHARRCGSRRRRSSGRCWAFCRRATSTTRSRSPTGYASGSRPRSARRSLTSAYEFINRIEAGLVMVNLPSAGVEYHVPFGGSKASSMGMREQGPVAIDFYSEWQTAYIKY